MFRPVKVDRTRHVERLEARCLLAADVRVEFRIDHFEQFPGSHVDYQLLVTNDGPDDVNGLMVEHDVSAFLEDPVWRRETFAKERWNRSTLEQQSTWVLEGPAEEESFGRRVTRAGDVNGDGVDDAIVGWSAGTWGGRRSTSAYVVFGRPETDIDFERLAVEELDGEHGFRLDGGDDDITSFHAANDVNGDGLDDIVVGAAFSGTSPPLSPQSKNGITYVVFGREDAFPAQVNLHELNGQDGFAIYGDSVRVGEEEHAVYGARTGFSVSGAGDFNGDGLDDILIGTNAWYNASAAYVVFGSKTPFPARQQLKDLDGRNGLRIFHGDGFNTAQSVAAAGDFNGDGMDDIIVGSYGSDVEAYVVFGADDAWPKELDLRQIRSGDGFVFRAPFQGYNQGGFFNSTYGTTVNGVGDMNGDGFDDVIVGAPRTTVLGRIDAGAAYVLFGADTPPGELSHDELHGANGFAMSGRESDVRIGLAVEPAGDINADGLDDAIVHSGVFGSLFRKQGAFLLFGQERFQPHVELSTLDGRQGVFLDQAVRVHSPGDLNQDGIDDLLAGYLDNTVLLVPGRETVDSMPADGQGSIQDDLSLAAGATATYSLSGRVSASLTDDAELAASALFRSNDVDPVPENNHAFEIIPTIRDVDLVISSETRTFDVVPGDLAHLEFTITNRGLAKSASTQFTDSLDELFSSYTWTSTLTRPVEEHPAFYDISSLDGENGFEIRLDDPSNVIRPGELGDFNGDGLADFTLALSRADARGVDSGAVFIVFGSADRDQPSYDHVQPGRDGVLIVGREGEELGRTTTGVGDINGDGLDDLIVVGDDTDVSYVVLGSREPDWVITASAFEPRNGFRIAGRVWPARLGDINGDGFDDFWAGGHVVFGRAQFPDELDLTTLTSTDGFAVDAFVATVGAIGDVTGDGIDDLGIGRTRGFTPRPMYVLPGRRDGFPGLVTEESILAELGGFEIANPRRLLTFADHLGPAGDVNGDGIPDLAIGSTGNVPSDTTRSGLAILLGAREPQPEPVLGQVTIDSDSLGRYVKGIGDLNGDGLDDVLVDGFRQAYVVFGSRGIEEFDFTFEELAGLRGFEITERQPSQLAATRAIGDVNGDGVGDLLLGGRGVAKVFYGPSVTEQASGSNDLPRTLDIGIGTTITYSITGVVRRDLDEDVAMEIRVAPDSTRTDLTPDNNLLSQTFEVRRVVEGDVDANGRVDFRDFLIISSHFGTSVVSRGAGDLDGNGRVDFADFIALSTNYGRS